MKKNPTGSQRILKERHQFQVHSEKGGLAHMHTYTLRDGIVKPIRLPMQRAQMPSHQYMREHYYPLS